MPSVKVNGIHMYYETTGDGEPLCLIDGLGTNLIDYKGIIGQHSQTYKVIAFDNRGSGRSDKPDEPYTIEMMAEDTAGLLQAIGIKHAHILGVSMGGRIALQLTLAHPEMAKSLILVSTYAGGYQPLKQKRIASILVRIRMPWDKYPQPYYAFVRQRNASRSYDARARLHEISAPTLIMHGTKDKIAPLELAEEMHAGIANSQMITFNAGHYLIFLKARQVAEAVRRFLESGDG